ncbi:MAG: TatD family deoxyribonuclease [Crocinitomicaceae bacterium]|nr:TatD family deoxyribonuclease [Crocinitomicaceae bacterium]
MLIDTHTHLYSSQFDQDREEVIQQSINNGVDKFLLPNIDKSSIQGMLSLQQKFPLNCYAMMGLHPCSVDQNWEQELEEIKTLLQQERIVAIGEIGIDLYWDKTYVEQQKEAFTRQISWAKEMNLPIVIHARDSFSEIYSVLDQVNDERLKGVFHCFTGSAEDVSKIQSYGGFKFGIGGVLTFKKSGLDEVVKNIPIEEILLETDAPYLAPTPHRGKRNESTYLPLIASKLSDIFEISEQEVARITSQNAMDLFRL